ncbi:MAG TPA: dihydrolipoamide acetyltransferase family protein [Acidimicrobiia bacterium]|nr:dihydrolipoamide acetyltransferase family protein [Acidimicrobiia bacterium]
MIDFALPSLGADMDQAMLVTWLVEPGDEVKYGQVIAEVETDKGVIEIECWHDGIVEELLVEPSQERLPVGTLLARLRPMQEETPRAPLESPLSPPPAEHRPARLPIPPPIRHLAHSLGVDLESLRGTGAGGAITREDVRTAAGREVSLAPATVTVSEPTGSDRVKASPRARALANQRGLDLTSVIAGRIDGLVTYADVEAVGLRTREPEDKVSAMRRAITRSMSRSKKEIPHYYLAARVDMSRTLDWLERLNAERPIAGRILPAVPLLKATALAAREVPNLNGHWLNERFVPADSVHLGVAISLREGGLVAPAIHHADMLDLSELMERLRDLVTRARSWRLRGSEMSDPTITVTNLGDRGAETGFPIIIPPQVAMVSFGRVVDEVVAVDKTPVVHPVVHATVAADHRVTDGHTGGLLLGAIDRLLQTPEGL